jgi:hypothetical protein
VYAASSSLCFAPAVPLAQWWRVECLVVKTRVKQELALYTLDSDLLVYYPVWRRVRITPP